MGFKCITVRREGAVEHLVLDRPGVRNAFDEEMIREITWWAESVAADRDVRVIVLSGAGPSFCSGADLRWMAKVVHYSRDENVQDATDAARMFLALDRLPLPVVARVHGAALGGGAGLCAVADIVVAADDAVFGFTEVKLGIIPAVISPFVIAKIGRSAARELFLTGRRFDAARAREIGLVHAVVPPEDLDREVTRYLRELLAAAPGAVAAIKGLIPDVHRRGPGEATTVTCEALAERRASAEGQDGLRSFLEKRKPRWIVDAEVEQG
jgi:methylglutaconyl-CoA hydratase